MAEDGEVTVNELAEPFPFSVQAVSKHLKVLERAGLIRVVRTRRIRAVTEKYYGRTARLFVFRLDDDAGERALASVALRQASHELEQAPEGAHFSLVRARLAPDDLRRLVRRLERLVDDFRAADSEDGVMHVLTTGFWNTERRDA